MDSIIVYRIIQSHSMQL